MDLASLALQVPRVWLPNPEVDLAKWAVIACDQYTSEPNYWQQVALQVGAAPSTLHLIFPEVYLETADAEQRIAAINQTMGTYLADGTLVDQGPGFVLLDRRTSQTPSRKGLVVCLDLEQYDYRQGAKTLIRATEGTIVDRLPPRIRVRENAALELPHIMVLLDDPQQTVIEPLFAETLPELYDFELMCGGGHLKGWHVAESSLWSQVGQALARLADPARMQQRYGVVEDNVLLYAMGDGNHSFATAKAIWEQFKQETADPAAVMAHPARYALVELVNVHDPGLEFEAIHRCLFEVEVDDLLEFAAVYFASTGASSRITWCAALDEAVAAAAASDPTTQAIPLLAAGRPGLLCIDNPGHLLAVGSLQGCLDAYLDARPAGRIDYIHGEETVTRLAGADGVVGFYLPTLSKHDLFRTIVHDGVLPRKTFSMGEADEKRFYLEARRITR